MSIFPSLFYFKFSFSFTLFPLPNTPIPTPTTPHPPPPPGGHLLLPPSSIRSTETQGGWLGQRRCRRMAMVQVRKNGPATVVQVSPQMGRGLMLSSRGWSCVRRGWSSQWLCLSGGSSSWWEPTLAPYEWTMEVWFRLGCWCRWQWVGASLAGALGVVTQVFRRGSVVRYGLEEGFDGWVVE